MVDYIKKDRIAFITFNRPEAKNAIDPPTHKRLWEIWKDFESDNSVDVAILTGKGDAFCAGAAPLFWLACQLPCPLQGQRAQALSRLSVAAPQQPLLP